MDIRGTARPKVMIGFLLHLALVCQVVHGQPQSEDPEPASLETVQGHLNEKRYSRALEATDLLIDQTNGTERALALNARGWTLFEMGNSRRAQQAFEEALLIARESGSEDTQLKILNNMGINLFVSGNLEQARDYFVEAQNLGSTLSDTYLGIIDSQLRFREIRSHITAGVTHRLNLAFPEAIEEYSKALDIDPDNIDALSYRGYAHFRNRDYDAAFDDIEAVLRLDPARLDALINYIKTACASGADERLKRFLAEHSSHILDASDQIEQDHELERACTGFSPDLSRVGIGP